jgi:hypothetical protein
MFRALRGNGKTLDPSAHVTPTMIGFVVLKYTKKIGLDRGYSAHSMRATFARLRAARRSQARS